MVNNEFINLCKICIEIVDDVAEKISDVNDTQIKIRNSIYAFIGAVIGIYLFSNNIKNTEKDNNNNNGHDNIDMKDDPVHK
jgi:hypothetical protein